MPERLPFLAVDRGLDRLGELAPGLYKTSFPRIHAVKNAHQACTLRPHVTLTKWHPPVTVAVVGKRGAAPACMN